MKKITYFILAAALLYACQNESLTDWKETNLLACCQLPISIMAPDSVEIKSSNLGSLFKDVTIQKDDDFFVQIYASEATTNDIAKIKFEQLKQVKEFPFYSKMIEEDENGFLYENIIDSSTIYYSYRYIAVQGDMEYIFQPGTRSLFTEGEARRMYQAVQQ